MQWAKKQYTSCQNIHPTSTDLACLTWVKGHDKAILSLSTDNILFTTNQPTLFHAVCAHLKGLFQFTTQSGPLLCYIGWRIVQSPVGISIDQDEHLQREILAQYWPKDANPAWTDSPFPLDP